MNVIYSLFYTVFSLAIVSAVALPVVLFIRFVIIKTPKKFILYLWELYLIRSICPISLSSIFSISPEFNRKFHIFLDSLGLSFITDSGILNGWQSVFIKPFTVNTNFMFYSFLWLAGVFFLWIYTFIKQVRIRRWLDNSTKLEKNIFQHERLNIPVMTGIFVIKKYLPGKMNVAEAKYILKHMDIHEQRHDGILRAFLFLIVSIQWFNPFIWIAYYFICRDIETAADEDSIIFFGIEKRAEYAQEIINMDKGNKVINPSLVTFQEKYIEDRASKMLYQSKILKKDRQIVILITLLIFVWWFMFRPIQILWNDGLWNSGNNLHKAVATEQPLFSGITQNVIAKEIVKSPEGLDIVVKIIMIDGEESASGYDGKFKIILEDSSGNKLGEESLDKIYSIGENSELHFDKDVVLCVSDYNNDGVNEIAIGQNIEASADNWKAAIGRKAKKKKEKKIKNIQQYYLWNVEGNALRRVSESIYFTGKKGTLVNSCKFKIPVDTIDVIKSKVAGNKLFYVWDDSKKLFIKKKLSKKQLKEYKKDGESYNSEKITHSLNDSLDKEIIRVTTQKDSTGSEDIRSVTILSDGEEKEFDNIKGYYCDIQWVETMDNNEKRYAVVTYNGTKSQTFVVYDTKKKKVYYKQEDGNSVLSKVFKRYNGDSISFEKNDIVVYTLQEKKGDILKIGFAANANNNVTVKGSYKYNVESENQYEFSYSQSTE